MSESESVSAMSRGALGRWGGLWDKVGDAVMRRLVIRLAFAPASQNQ
jgi:hypothetical protein